jgi:hypothetical protein
MALIIMFNPVTKQLAKYSGCASHSLVLRMHNIPCLDFDTFVRFKLTNSHLWVHHYCINGIFDRDTSLKAIWDSINYLLDTGFFNLDDITRLKIIENAADNRQSDDDIN